MTESQELKPTPTSEPPRSVDAAEDRKANRNFLIWWIGLPLVIMLLVVLLRDRV